MSSRVRDKLLTAGAVAFLLACSTAPAAGAATTAATDGFVELLECARGKRAADRNALFRGEMRQIPDGAGMRMRFALEERVGRGAWRAVKAPGLDVWRYARSGVARFAYRQRIAALRIGTSYRVAVKFQWHDAAGMLIERQAARSPVCRQGGQLPNVRVGALERHPGPTPDTVRYVVAVVNPGGATAKRVAVSLLVDGAEVDTRGIGDVGARGRREVAFVGPACASLITVRLDPDRTLRELEERDNVRSFACAG
jgi:hypothetical protein